MKLSPRYKFQRIQSDNKERVIELSVDAAITPFLPNELSFPVRFNNKRTGQYSDTIFAM